MASLTGPISEAFSEANNPGEEHGKNNAEWDLRHKVLFHVLLRIVGSHFFHLLRIVSALENYGVLRMLQEYEVLFKGRWR